MNAYCYNMMTIFPGYPWEFNWNLYIRLLPLAVKWMKQNTIEVEVETQSKLNKTPGLFLGNVLCKLLCLLVWMLAQQILGPLVLIEAFPWLHWHSDLAFNLKPNVRVVFLKIMILQEFHDVARGDAWGESLLILLDFWVNCIKICLI